MTEYANFDDASIPSPAGHAPPLHAYPAHGGLREGTCFVVSEHADRDAASISGAFIKAGETVAVER